MSITLGVIAILLAVTGLLAFISTRSNTLRQQLVRRVGGVLGLVISLLILSRLSGLQQAPFIWVGIISLVGMLTVLVQGLNQGLKR
ncbi:hypothetical protein NBRC116494_27440 [Aurantivibrio plasticivorans]